VASRRIGSDFCHAAEAVRRPETQQMGVFQHAAKSRRISGRSGENLP
jgi:hypothetical protein